MIGAFGRGSAFSGVGATTQGHASKVSGCGGDVKTAITRDCTKSINGGVGFSAVIATVSWSFGARCQWINSVITSLSHTSVGSAIVANFEAADGKPVRFRGRATADRRVTGADVPTPRTATTRRRRPEVGER